MRKSKKTAEHKKVEQQLSADSDELQLKDECNSEWVEAWRDATKHQTDLEVYFFKQDIQETKLIGTHSKKR